MRGRGFLLSSDDPASEAMMQSPLAARMRFEVAHLLGLSLAATHIRLLVFLFPFSHFAAWERGVGGVHG